MIARLVLAIGAGTAALGAGVGLVAVAAWLIATAATHPPVLELMVAVVAVRALGISKGVFRYVERLLAHDVAFRALAALRLRVYAQLTRTAPSVLARFHRGDLLARLSDDVAAVQDWYARVIVPAVSGGLAGVLAIAIATALLPAAGLVLTAGLTMSTLAVPLLAGRASAWADRRLAAGRAELSGRIVELLHGADELAVLGALPDRQASLAQIARRLAGAESRLAWIHGLSGGLGTLILAGTLGATLLVAAPAVSDGRLDGPGLAVLVLLPIAAFDATAGTVAAFRDRERVAAALDRVDDVLRLPVPPQRIAAVAEPVGHGITIRGLTVRWPDADRDALHEIELDLPPGRRVAVVGPSGAGKSTLLACLLRLCPYTGQISVGGVELAAISEQTLRRLVGVAASDAHIFDSSLAANLRLARPDATEPEMKQALGRAGLLGWTESLPRGLDTPVGEHGQRLSGGQRQRLALARALLADVPVLLCDEPDAALDPALADRIVADLLAAAGDRTVVLVTHRLPHAAQVDEVVVLDGGRARRAALDTAEIA